MFFHMEGFSCDAAVLWEYFCLKRPMVICCSLMLKWICLPATRFLPPLLSQLTPLEPKKWREIDTASRSAELWQSFRIHIPRFSHLWRSKMTRRGDLVVVLFSSEGWSLLLVGITSAFELALPLNCVLAVMIKRLCRGGSWRASVNFQSQAT